MANEAAAQPLLLALPEPCLLAVLQCLAATDQRSLFSAARAHSRLRQAAVAALRSITAVCTQQQQMDSMLGFLRKHGQHVNSIETIVRLRKREASTGWPSRRWQDTVRLRGLPSDLHLNSLSLDSVHVQLHPYDTIEGVLGSAAVADLKQLRLKDCRLLDCAKQLAAVWSLLPVGLEHLSISSVKSNGEWVQFPTAALQRLQQLTYLELSLIKLQGLDGVSVVDNPVLQPLQALTRLVDLRLTRILQAPNGRISAEMLSGMQHLTRLELSHGDYVEPDVLAGKTKLRHLQLHCCNTLQVTAWAGQLLLRLQTLHQLTNLTMGFSWWLKHKDEPPAAAYSALTASSKLQHLDIRGCTVPAGVWQHVFPPRRQLPHLRSLNISAVRQSSALMPHVLTAAGLSAAALACSTWTCGVLDSTVQRCWPHCRG
jgi:hypothetical protein